MKQCPPELTDRLTRLLRTDRRVILGLAGPPGSGKSSLASHLAAATSLQTTVIPMDGFHLANQLLDVMGLRHCKGAPETFDALGFASLIARAAECPQNGVLYAPEFDRTCDAAIAGAIALSPTCKLIIVEGNYLLCNGVWAQARAHMDSVWYLDVKDASRQAWLVERHMRFGRSHAEALQWVEKTDEPNARLIKSCMSKADWVIPHRTLEKIYQ